MLRVPEVSVIVPTYNRAYSIVRAIDSVRAQTVTDWELILVDDGSTDGTAELVHDRDERIKIVSQPNGGFVSARNTGLRHATGRYIAFLDSDDEWTPLHLELTIAFLDAHRDRAWVVTEITELGPGSQQRHYWDEFSRWYPGIAFLTHSRRLDLPANTDDHYLRVYQERTPIGAWGEAAVAQLDNASRAYVYSGCIFDHLRWGYVVAVNSLVMRRDALDAVGLLDPKCGLAADYEFTSRLCRRYTASMISVPTYIKHLLPPTNKAQSESHLASGASALACARQNLDVYDQLFPQWRNGDEELRRIRGLKLYDMGLLSLKQMKLAEARTVLRESRTHISGFAPAILFDTLLRIIPDAVIRRTNPQSWMRFAGAINDVSVGRLGLAGILAKLMPWGWS